MLVTTVLPVSLTLRGAKTSRCVSGDLIDRLKACKPLTLVTNVCFAASLVAVFVDGATATILLTPVTVRDTARVKMDPMPFLFTIALKTDVYFTSPFSAPPGTLIVPTKRCAFVSCMGMKLPLRVVVNVIVILMLPLLFPFWIICGV